jgi:hypothetical protein
LAKTAQEIIDLYRRRQSAQGPEKQKMREICALYNGDMAIGVPDLGEEHLRPAIVNLAKQGINQLAMRCASVMPNLLCPPVDYGRQDSARMRADQRRRVTLAWWNENHVARKLRRRSRWMFAYAEAPVVIRPDFARKIPMWNIRSPLDCYASTQSDDPDEMVPRDVIFATIHQAGYVRERWPNASLVQLRNAKDDDRVEVLEYIDRDEFHLVCAGSYRTAWDIEVSTQVHASFQGGFTLDRVPNRVGRTPVVIPRGISLEGRAGQFDGLVNMFQAQGELEVLSRIARRKGVFAEEWLVARSDGETPEIIDEANPMAGVVGRVTGGQLVRIAPDVQYATDAGVDRYERNQRVEAGIPADFGGEAGTGIRTGARASQIHANVIEPVLQEAQNLFAESLMQENELAMHTDRHYFGSPKKSIYVSWKNESNGTETYSPETLWGESTRNKVEYALAGADANAIAIAVLQRIGAGTISKHTGMMLDPFVTDVDAEMRGVEYDRLTNALATQMEQLASTPGGMPLPDLARTIELIQGGMPMWKATLQVQTEAQKRQASQAQTPDQAQPGIAMPGQGAEAAPMIAPSSPDQNNLRQMLHALHSAPQQESPVGLGAR